MRHSGGSLASAFVVVAMLVSACTPAAEDPVPTTPTEPSPPSTTTTAAAVAATSTTTTAPSDLIQLPLASPIEGDAPVVPELPGDVPVNYFRYSAVFDNFEGPPLPDGLDVELHGCTLLGPGVILYDLTLSGDVAYPLEAVVFAAVYAGDQGTGTYGHVDFVGEGRQLLVSSLPDQSAPYEEIGELAHRNDRVGNQVERRLDTFREGTSCQLELGPNYDMRSEYVDLVADPSPLSATAPSGTVESLAQAAYPDGGDADLLPIAIAYGEALRFYADVWFIPERPGHLDRMEERLSDEGCLELEFTYRDYTVLQSLDCPFVAGAAVREVGSEWFATATDGRWIVTVAGGDESLVTETANSLRPYWHLFHREIPLEPVDETVMGRAEFDGVEYLVTFGEQRCEGSCRSPETWFYIYKILETGLEEYAHYPGFGECLLAEEDEFVLAVAPDRGSIEVEAPGLSGLITGDDANPFFFESTADGPFTLRVLDEDGNEARCVGTLASDGRGGIGPFPGSSEPAPDPEADRTIVAEACSTQPWYLEQFTDEDPLRQACVDTDFGQSATSLVVPNEMLAEPPQPEGLICLVEQTGSGAGARCSEDGTIPVLSGGEGFRTFSVVVPNGTSRIVGVTSGGTELIGTPYDGIAVLWWVEAEGELRQVTAETPSGPITFWPES